ncbi:DNA polymerase III subunit gamma/tau [Patulibacter brassicae]|uniref:DNA polymerase III subunit gamma/tau n=1 Tax=Patulibacter brassicae TaxID=1705717 RepID=A0ABU4VH44_9ACTN|nr:DNA polymerase III subunit gamma/tau [Patulibacter brassicae]MDX8151135.1 DNA polymerase III subunit gamma/tau [Patulibacter brassicae]
MSGPSLYRRHRPRSFDDVVGQEHVVRTLRNAIDQGKVHHAYLFVGSRGTGKTSMAKILAACLNCQGDPDLPPAERVVGPTTHPCGKCEACRSIADATSIDVVEMDAASNNSVDDIRELRDAVAFAPVGGRSKVYILDEAHMLSSAAWNAFLKTLEEPPPRTIFVLATTEANKVLPTVVDRCHRFDFHRPTPDQLQRVLDRVAVQEGIAIDPEATALVARHATGSFRDALGTLEQLVTYAGEQITNQDVLSVLGVADAELLFRAVDAIAAGDGALAIQVAAELAAQGRDLTQVTRDLESHARALLLVRMTGDLPAELRITDDRDRRTIEQAQRLPGATVIRILDLVAAALAAVRDGADPRTQLELLLVRAALPQIDPQTKALAARIARLEQSASGSLPAPPAAAPAPPAGGVPAPPTPGPGPIPGPPSPDPAPPTPGPEPIPGPPSPDPAPPTPGPEPIPGPPPPNPAPPTPRPAPAGDWDARPAAAGAAVGGERGAPSTGSSDASGRPPQGPPQAASAPPRGGATSAGSGTPDDWGTPPQGASPTAGPSSGHGASSQPASPASAPSPDGGTPSPSAAPSADWGASSAGGPVTTPGGGPAHQPPPATHAAVQGHAGPAVQAPAATHGGHAGAVATAIAPSDIDELLPQIGESLSRPAAFALAKASTVSLGDGQLVLGVPQGATSAANLLNRDDVRSGIADAIRELHGIAVQVRAEERAEVAVAVEEPLPEDEVLRRVVQQFDAEEIGEPGGAAATPNGDGA